LKQSRCSQDLVARSYGNREQFRELRCCARTIGTRRRKQICRQCRFVHVKGGPKAARTVPELTRSADIKLNARVSLRCCPSGISVRFVGRITPCSAGASFSDTQGRR
jgi:hypothetical protein